MVRKSAVSIGLLAAGALTGAASSGLFQKHVQLKGSEPRALPKPSALGSEKDVELLRAQYDPQIARLVSENDELRQRLSEAGVHTAGRPLTQSEWRAQLTELTAKYEADKKKRAVDRLLAAGYSPERIEWLKRRAEELQKQRRLAETELRKQGLPVDPEKESAYTLDPDIELRYEIGDAEYERYQLALGRLTYVHVTEVMPGSIAESAGIRTGDVILDYDNKRLFNRGELDGLAMGKTGQSATVTVNRDGAILKFVVPGGHLGIRARRPE